MPPIRAVVYGVGEMGAICTRLLVERGVEIVGALARSEAKLGRDLGEVAGLGQRLGVPVEADADALLARTRPDVAVVCVSSYLRVMLPHFATCLEHGANVVTIEEEALWPWHSDPERGRELDELAKAHGVSLLASGAQDVYWFNLVTTLLGAAHRVDEVVGRTTWNADDYGAEVARHVHVGETPAEFDAFAARQGWDSFVVRNNVDALVAHCGLTPAATSSVVDPVLADGPTFSRALATTVEPGRLVGVVDRVTIETREGPRFTFEMAGRIYGPGERDVNDWVVRGDPAELHLRNERVPTREITCTTLVNRIPDVLAAPPGLVTIDQLPPARYRHGRFAVLD